MIALNIVLMTAVVVGVVSLLGWAVVSDRKSRRTAGGSIAPAQAPLHRNLVLPRELRAHSVRAHTPPARRRRVGSPTA